MPTTDLCIYGGTSAGVIAAIAAAKLKLDVLLIEPSRHLGGMSSGGLGFTDFGNKAAIGGLSREFYRRLGKLYDKEEAWTFEPHCAEQVFRDWIAEAGVRVLFEHRITEAETDGGRLRRILLERVPADPANAPGPADAIQEHVEMAAAFFIDASYEGDLMARAKVSSIVGREPVALHGESLNGIRAVTPKHQFLVPVDPYIKPGVPSSGLLPLIQPGDGGRPGDGDHRVQAYNFRLCLTKNRENFIPIAPPEGYNATRYELLARHIEGLVAAGKPLTVDHCIKIDHIPNGKTDINNNGAVSTDLIGGSWTYPAADYAERAAIWHEHLAYTQGLFHFLATSERVPAPVRQEIGAWGLCKDEFHDTGGWPHHMYIREARRMIGAHVVTQADCEHRRTCDDSIGLGAYNMDSHNCQRVVQQGVVRNEGDVQAPPAGPYAISYRAITPKASECENLLVPVCLSATHIAYGSIRMEPVFMLLGESAAVAAHLAFSRQTSVQDVSRDKLRERLLHAGQVLEWKPPAKAGQ